MEPDSHSQFGVNHQFRQRQVQSRGDAHQVHDSDVLLSALDGAYVGPVDFRPQRQFFLGHTALAPSAPDRQPQRDQNRMSSVVGRGFWHRLIFRICGL